MGGPIWWPVQDRALPTLLATMRHAILLWRSIFQGKATQLGGRHSPRPSFPPWATGGHQGQHALTLRRWRNQVWVKELYGRGTHRAPTRRHPGGGYRRV